MSQETSHVPHDGAVYYGGCFGLDNLAITGNTHTKLVSESLTTAGNVQFTQSYYVQQSS